MSSRRSATKAKILAELFADSYAFVSLFEGNDRYLRIFRKKKLVTSALNVLEVYSTLLRRLPPSEAREFAEGMLTSVCSIPPEVALAAGEFRQSMRSLRKDCSYVDAWGYAAAVHLGLPFLTGDPAFRSVERVEFVR